MKKKVIEDIISWDVINWSKTLQFWKSYLDISNGTALALGERNGGISLWLGIKGAQVICSDRKSPTEYAKNIHKKYGLIKQIVYKEVDIFCIPYPDDYFDIVACKSVIGGLKRIYHDGTTRNLSNQKIAVKEIMRVLKPGGYFLGAENLTGTKLHESLRKWKKKGKIGWRHLSTSEVQFLFTEYSEFHQKTYGFLGTFFSNNLVNRITGFVDKVISPILPDNWKYISFIVARK